MDEAALQLALEEIDAEGNGMISFDEFDQWCALGPQLLKRRGEEGGSTRGLARPTSVPPPSITVCLAQASSDLQRRREGALSCLELAVVRMLLGRARWSVKEHQVYYMNFNDCFIKAIGPTHECHATHATDTIL